MSATATTEVLSPGDTGYDDARRVWNGAIDRRPALVVRPRDAHDVTWAVRCARERGLEIAVKGGGHSPVGHSVTDGGLQIDFSAMRRVEVDPLSRRVRVEPGALLGRLQPGSR